MSDLNATEVQERFAEEVRSIRRAFPDAVLAGGAVRDTLLGRPVKDRDYLVTGEATPEFLQTLFGTPFHYVNINAVMYSAPDGGSGLRYVLESDDKTINVLVCSSIQKKINSFPDDISMAWFDGEVIYTDPRFDRAVANKSITFAARSRESRLHRLQEKYDDEYTFNETPNDIID